MKSWPVPLPKWFWPWLQWYTGKGEYVGKRRNPAYRPPAPKKIPQWAWDRLKVHLGQAPAPPSPPKPPPVTPSPMDPPPVNDDVLAFWRRMSVWITRIDHFLPDWLPQYGQSEYRIVILPCLRGVSSDVHTEGLPAWIARAKALGFKVVGSQWGLATDEWEAQREAEAALAAVNKFGFDGWVMNGEKIYEGGGKSGAYIRRFRASRPNFPLGWSPEPRISIDHAELQRLNVCYMPQAYPLENKWDVLDVMDVATALFGYAPKNVIPLIQAYKSPAGVRYPAETYRRDARTTGAKGLCLYTGNQCLEAPVFWRELVV